MPRGCFGCQPHDQSMWLTSGSSHLWTTKPGTALRHRRDQLSRRRHVFPDTNIHDVTAKTIFVQCALIISVCSFLQSFQREDRFCFCDAYPETTSIVARFVHCCQAIRYNQEWPILKFWTLRVDRFIEPQGLCYLCFF